MTDDIPPRYMRDSVDGLAYVETGLGYDITVDVTKDKVMVDDRLVVPGL